MPDGGSHDGASDVIDLRVLAEANHRGPDRSARSRASDIDREAADIVLLKSEIAAVPEALGLAQATLRTIKQNLFWAFAYNTLGIPVAALGLLSPMLASAAMALSRSETAFAL